MRETYPINNWGSQEVAAPIEARHSSGRCASGGPECFG